MFFLLIFKRLTCLLTCLLALSALSAGPAPAHADSVERFAEELVKLRGEVEALNSDLDRKRSNHQMEMRALQSRRGELQVEVERETLKIEKLKQGLAKQRETARRSGVEGRNLAPVVYRAIDDLEAFIRGSLPFKTEERLAEVDELREQIQSGFLTPHKAVNRLWTLYEDEIRLAGENGLDRQPIRLDGKERLADVARVGMVMLFFRTSDGEYGRVIRKDGIWDYEILRGDAADDVSVFFDSLDKQIRTGFFELPNALVSAEIEEKRE